MIGFNKFMVTPVGDHLHIGNLPHSILTREEAANLAAAIISAGALEAADVNAEITAMREALESAPPPPAVGKPQTLPPALENRCPRCGSLTMMIHNEEYCRSCGGQPIKRGPARGAARLSSVPAAAPARGQPKEIEVSADGVNWVDWSPGFWPHIRDKRPPAERSPSAMKPDEPPPAS
jgi:hypothetical protein